MVPNSNPNSNTIEKTFQSEISNDSSKSNDILEWVFRWFFQMTRLNTHDDDKKDTIRKIHVNTGQSHLIHNSKYVFDWQSQFKMQSTWVIWCRKVINPKQKLKKKNALLVSETIRFSMMFFYIWLNPQIFAIKILKWLSEASTSF